MAKKKLVLGCGYLGHRVANWWRSAGHQVFVATRCPQRATKLQQEGFYPLVLDVTKPETLAHLPQVDTVLYAVGYDRGAGQSRRAVYVDGVQQVLDRLPTPHDRLVYVSSTGVYGQSDGQWVDEESVCAPVREGGTCCLAAEQRLQRSSHGPCTVILRLAGLYGPHRVPFLERIKRRESLPVDPEGYLNLIHVDDAVRAVMAAQDATLPRTFVVADGRPVRRREYYEWIGDWLGVPPSFGPVDLQSTRAERGSSSKRIRNDRIVRELGLDFVYPDYRAGLASILDGSSA